MIIEIQQLQRINNYTDYMKIRINDVSRKENKLIIKLSMTTDIKYCYV